MIHHRGAELVLRTTRTACQPRDLRVVSRCQPPNDVWRNRLENPNPSIVSFKRTQDTKVLTSRKIQVLVCKEHRLLFVSKDEKPENFDEKEQDKKVNLGKMIEELKDLVPEMLNKSLPKELISRNIQLRICPTHFNELNAYLPNLKGHVSYYTTCKTLQVILTSVVLNPNVKLHIQSIRTSLSPGEASFEAQCFYPDSTKIYVRWNTCPEGCSHLLPKDSSDELKNHYSTSAAKLGSHKWSKVDPEKFVNSSAQGASATSLTSRSLAATLSSLTSSLTGLTKEVKKLERLISGIFIFELSPNNDEIVAHTIEDIDVEEKTEKQDVDGELRVC